MAIVTAQVGWPSCLLWAMRSSQFQGAAGSTPTNPFANLDAMSILIDVTVSDLDRVEMSTYQREATTGWYNSLPQIIKYVDG